MKSNVAAEKWGISTRTVQKHCKNGLIRGAELIEGKWFIPDDTTRPYIIKNNKNRKQEDDYFDILTAINSKQSIDESTLKIKTDYFSAILELLLVSGWIKKITPSVERITVSDYLITEAGIDYLNKKRQQRLEILKQLIITTGKSIDFATEIIKRIPNTPGTAL